MKTMKNFLSVMVILPVCFLFSGCGEQDSTDQMKDQVPSGQVKNEQIKVEKNLMNWMEGREAVKCEIEIEEGMTMVMMAKDGKVRMEGMPYSSMNAMDFDSENTDGVSLTSGDWVYNWSKKSQEGVKFSMSEMEKLGEGAEDNQSQDSDTWEEQVQGWENSGVKYDCQKAQLDDSLFEEPAGVEFVDMGEKMKGLVEMGEKFEMQNGEGTPSMDELKDMLPEGVEMPEM
jgi:hypothetical protein